MSAVLYSMAILRLAAQSGDWPLLAKPDAQTELRAALCGSIVIADAMLDGSGQICAIGIEAKACALGQAAATVLARHAIGQAPEALVQAASDWGDWLAGTGETLPDWPGLADLAEVRDYPARHAAVRLPFDALAAAATKAASLTGIAHAHG